MNDKRNEDRGTRRRIVHDRGNRYVLPRSVSDQAHRDAFGDPTIPFRDLDSDGQPIRFPADPGEQADDAADADRNDERDRDDSDRHADDWGGDRERDNAENDPHRHRTAR